MSHKLILMDGSAFLFRAYFSTISQNLTNNDGFPTGAMFGVIGAIKRLQSQHPDATIITIFDHKGKNFRHDIYPEYKAHRKPAESDLIIQIEPLYEIIRAMGLRFLCVPGVEADDVIATLSQQSNKQNIKTIIASSDKDLMQLVSNNIEQLDMKGNLLDYKGVIEKMGVEPDQMMDFLSLTGDSADNIPGVPSVGPKTAIKWLQLYGDISGVKENADKIMGKVGDKLRDSFDLLDLSHKLVELKFDVELPDNIIEFEPQQDKTELARLYKKYGFALWLNQLDGVDKKSEINVPDKRTDNYDVNEITSTTDNFIETYTQTLVLDKNAFDDLATRLKRAKAFVLDLETTSLNYMNAKIVGWVFLVDHDSFYVPVGHDYIDAPKQLDFDTVMSSIKPILEDTTIGKVGHNLKYDSHVLENYGVSINSIIDDTMVKSYCLNSVASRHNMDDLSEYYLNHKTIHFADIAGKGKKQITFNQVNLEQAMPYACEDVIVTFELNKVLDENIAQYPKLVKLYQNLEIPLIKTLVRMERNGVKIDTDSLYSQHKDIVVQMESIKSKSFELSGDVFNLDSPKQIQNVLFSKDGLGLVAIKKTPKGQPSTNEESLKLLDHPLVDLILSYRTLTKLNSTYIEALPKQVNHKTNRLHTSYHQAVTATGRLSSSNPNLQNIPIRSDLGARIRGAFVADKNNSIIAADYSQIELRIMAHLSKDEHLLAAFKDNRDVHTDTASMMFNVPISEVTKDHRRNAKAINFGLIYGMSAFGLAKQINVSRTEAKQYIDSYFENYVGVLEYMNNIRESAKTLGYVETVMGRRLYLPQINAKNKMLQQHALRTAINAPMQGSSADIIKNAMHDVHDWIGENNKDIKIIMQVHDELVFEVKSSKSEVFANKIQELMQNAYKLNIPLVVDVGIGESWQQAH